MLKSLLYRWGQRLINLYALLMFRMDFQCHIPLPDGPKIIVANHPSTTDPFLVMMLLREQVSILIHEPLFHIPFFGAYLRRIGHVPAQPSYGRHILHRRRQRVHRRCLYIRCMYPPRPC